MVLLNRLLAVGAAVGFHLSTVSAFPLSDPFADYPPVLKARQDDGEKVDLRILSLGASIMSGVGSEEHSGLRKWLRMALRYDGWEVNMVGTKQDGDDMTDKDHEATPGAVLTEVSKYLDSSLGYKANLVIINAGTNNANYPVDVDKARQQMDDILQKIWGYDDMAETCVILSTLLPTTNENGAKNRIPINEDFRGLVADYKDEKCIYLADMEPEGEGKDFFSLDEDIWSDNPKLHPNNEGHKRMAYVFYAALHRALSANKVKEAAPKESEPVTGCDKEFGKGEYVGRTQKGSGMNDGIYHHFSEEKGVILEIDSKWDRNQWRFARLFSRDYDDLLGWYEYEPNDHRFGVWKNSADGEGKFHRIDDLRGMIYCIPRGLHFIDMNADGLDDIVCISPDGDLNLAINEGNGNGDNLPTFKNLGQIKTGEASQDRIRLADIDGDGRGDYGVINDDGSVHFWRNGWVDDKPKYWQDLGVRSTMKPNDGGALAGIRFEDLNGDGRDDWMWMEKLGKTFTWTNSRSCQHGEDGDGLNVAWRQGFYRGNSEGPTHFGVGQFGDGSEDWRNRIHFARIYGTKPAFGNLGVQDYVFMEVTEGDAEEFKFKVRAWKNLGQGSTKLNADGVKYCNMVGHDNGLDDYVWTWSTGAMELYPNAGKNPYNDDESFWDAKVDMWTPPEDMDRKDLHLADWDGDGACDIIWVNPEGGNVRVFINDYPTKQSWDSAFHEINAPNLSCDSEQGIGFHDLSVRFADLTNNGRADYLCIHPDGFVKGQVQRDDGSWEDVGQIKFAEEADRANIRWADVNGDGQDDMLWVDKFNGNARVWYNDGRGNPDDNSGSSFKWRKVQDPVYEGKYAGTCQYFPDLDGNGRADLHSIMGTFTNEAETWYNPSCGLRDVTGDDPEGVIDPQLPVQPGNPIGGPGPGDLKRRV